MRVQKPPVPPSASASAPASAPANGPASTPYEHELKRNLSLSRTILFHASPSRLLSSRSYSIALRSTLRLSSSVPALRRAATEPCHLSAVAATEANLREARLHAAKKATTVPLAHDVFALLCGFLGADGRPQKAVQDAETKKRKEKEEEKLKEIEERANKAPRAFARVASGLIKVKDDEGKGKKDANHNQKRRFGKSISFMHPTNRKGFFDDDDESEDSDDKDDFYSAQDAPIAMSRVKSVRFTVPEEDEEKENGRKERTRLPKQGSTGMKRAKSSVGDYAIRVADVDT